MPLYKSISYNPVTKVLIWKITETFDELYEETKLNDSSIFRLKSMKSEQQQRAFLSVRKLLQVAGYSDFELFYDMTGKPHLKDGTHISITHSFGFSAIIVSDITIGIDIEMQRDKIIRIDYKFVDDEFAFLNKENTDDYVKKLTVIWGAKEAIFKIRNEVGISFKDHIKVSPFELNDGQCHAALHFGSKITDFIIHFIEVENFTLVYAFEQK